MKPNRAFKGRPCPFVRKILSAAVCFLLTFQISSITAQERQTGKNHLLKGRVISAEDHSPLKGASVVLKEKSIGASTDQEGRFILETVETEVVLMISCLGYLPIDTLIRLPLKGRLIIPLEPEAAMLETAVVKGYYTTSEAFNTGSVSTIKGEVLARQPVGDPILALQGKIPGLYISQTSGVAGASLDISLRGRNSIANGNAPLYIIDGVPFTSESLSLVHGGGISISPFSSIAIDNIERIDVLKDADATAIYGSRGANGVILITTKKGKVGKTEFTVNFNSGFGKIVKGYDLMNTQDYMEMRREAFENDGVAPGTTNYDINGTWDTARYTDWEKILIGGTSQLNNLHGSLSGGNEYTQFLLSGGLRNETSVFPGNYRNRKISIHSIVSHRSANRRFNGSYSVAYVNDNNLLPISDFTLSIGMPPNAPPLYNEDGNLNWANSTWNNPFAQLYRSSTSVTNNLNSTINLSYKLLPGLNITAKAGYNTIRMETVNLYPGMAVDPANINVNEIRQHRFGENGIQSWIAEPGINFIKSFDQSELEGIIGATFEESSQNGISFHGRGFSSDALIENIQAASSIAATSRVLSQYRYSALFARLGYTYKNRYVINLTGRRDGSSRFGPGKQFGNFGAIGLAWLFSRERRVMDIVPFLNFGKLRLSYGITGNDQLGDYKYLSTYASNSLNYQGVTGLNPVQHTNPEFGWEVVKKLEIALELAMLQNRIHIDVDWYRNRTINQLVGYPLPAMTGFNSVQANLPAIIQNSGLEFELSLNILKRNPFHWSVAGNLSIPKNKLVAYPNLKASSYANRYVVGMPLFISQRYAYTGLDQETGLYTFKDMNGDGVISSTNDRYPVFKGRKFFGGINNSLQFNGFQLDFFFQFVNQTSLLNDYGGFPGNASSQSGNLPSYFLNRWQQTEDIAPYQKFTQSYLNGRFYLRYLDSDAALVDASFIRLKNISLSWSASDKISQKIYVKNLEIYIQAQNVLTITKFQGSDPEISASSFTLPPLRMITGGVRFSIQ